MAGMRRLFVLSVAAGCIFMAPVAGLASRKATDMMSEALRQRAAGNLVEAISSFEYALENTSNNMQKNLARFMLGDCQLEAGKFADASRTFTELTESVTGSEEQAEALFRLMQAESGLGNRKQVAAIFSKIRQNHKSSPYFELAQAFVKSEGMRDEAQAARTAKPVAVAKVDPETLTAIAEPLIPKQPAEAARPAVEEKPVVEEKPAIVEKTEIDEKPAADEEPVVIEKPLVAKKADVSKKPAISEQPVEIEEEAAAVPSVKARDLQKPTTKNTQKAAAEPALEPALEPAVEPAPEAVAVKEKSDRKPSAAGAVKADADTAKLLHSALQIDIAEGSEKDELVSKILGYQDSLKDGPEKPGMDEVLFNLAETTVRFGELLEACKTYDQILTHHPASPLVEKAYYQSIRLRAVLGVHDAVIGWSKAFLAAFPASEYRSRIRALVDYAQSGGKLDLSAAGKGAVRQVKKAKPAAPASSGGNNSALLADSEYIEASRKMKDGRYNLALVDFNRLTRKYPDAPQIWWDVALVQVQLEDFKLAKKAIDQMVKLDPGNQDANSLAGYINYRLDNFEEAASSYDRAGEPEGQGVTFFDAKTASERMKKSAGSK